MLGAIVNDPTNSEFFWPTVVRVACLLGAGAVAVLVVERKRFAELRRSVLFQRVFSWVTMAPTFIAAIFVGGIVAFAVVAYLITQGLAEYARLVGLDRRYARMLLVTGLATLGLAGLLSEYFLFAPLVFFALVTTLPIVTGEVDNAHRQVTASLFGYIYLPFALSYLAVIKVVEPDGIQMLAFIGVAVALSDVIAFVVGSVFKGPKLAPRVSPNKTWAGVAGNIVGAFGALGLMWFLVPEEWSGLTLVLAPVTIALASLWGDLLESLLKRDFRVKDAGDVLPGFGGLLDRIDSLLLALPLTYYVVLVAERYTTGA